MSKYFCIAMLLSSIPAFAEPLDGRSYAIKYKEKGGWLSSKDTLIFNNGRFRSTACDSYGFGDAAYTAADGSAFQARTESVKEGRIAWQGQVHGDQVEGTFKWTKGAKTVEYTYKGSVTR